MSSREFREVTRSDLADWGIAPLEYVQDSWWAAVRERWWWYVFRRWTLNDVAPGIPDKENPGANRGWLNLKVLRLLHEIREAQDMGDHARSKCLHTELEVLGKDLNIPIHVAGNIIVPNMTLDQKTAIHRAARAIVKSTDTKAWEKQALTKLIRVVKSSTHSLIKEFSRKAREVDLCKDKRA